MRKITVAKLHKTIKLPTHSYEVYAMQPGTAWKIDVYGQHTVVEVDEALCKKADHVDGCVMQFDGRQMAIFKVGEQEYVQPMIEDSRATDDRLGKKRKIRKRKASAPRRDAPGVAPQAVAADEPAPARVRPVAPPGEPRPKGLLKRPLSLF